MPPVRSALIWAALFVAILTPVVVAALSPYLAYRDPIYIAAGFAGVAAMALLLLQPLLAGGYLPGLPSPKGRRGHRWIGALLIAAVLVHVGGLWLTSPPDVIDVLTFAAPTWFSVWGVIAMWAVFGAAALAACRRRLRIPMRIWRLGHASLVSITVVGGVAHAMLIEGTMGTVSKTALCILVLAATTKVLLDLRPWTGPARKMPRP